MAKANKNLILVDPQKHEVTLARGKSGQEDAVFVVFRKTGDILKIFERDYGGDCYFELPFSEVLVALEILKSQPQKTPVSLVKELNELGISFKEVR